MSKLRKGVLAGLICLVAVVVVAAVAAAPWDLIPRKPRYGPCIGGPAPQAPSAASYSFAFLGDTRGNVEILDKILRQARAAKVPFAVYGGDLVDQCTNSEFEQFYQAVNKATEGRLPMYLVIGNHDLEHLLFGRCITPYRNFFGPENYIFWYGPDAFVVFSNVPESFSEEQAAELEQTLTGLRAKNPRNIFLACHIPPVDPRGPREDKVEHCLLPDDGRRLLSLAKKYNVTAILASHIHGYNDMTVEGVHLIISGGAGARLIPGAHYNWALITVDGTKVTAKPMYLEQTPK